MIKMSSAEKLKLGSSYVGISTEGILQVGLSFSVFSGATYGKITFLRYVLVSQ